MACNDYKSVENSIDAWVHPSVLSESDAASGRREWRRAPSLSFLLSPARPLRTLMLSARRFAPGNLLGSCQDGNDGQAAAKRLEMGSFSGHFSSWGSRPSPRHRAPKLADYFGFLPLELYKLDNRIGNLQLKDLDGDKIDDIIVTNNGRSRIDLLLSTKKAADDKASRPFRKDPNELEYDRRMRLVSIPGQQGSRQRRYRRLQWRRQARPRLLRHAGRGRDPVQRGQRALRQSQEDQYRRCGPEAGGPGRGRLRPGRPRRPGPAGGEGTDLRLSDRAGQS